MTGKSDVHWKAVSSEMGHSVHTKISCYTSLSQTEHQITLWYYRIYVGECTILYILHVEGYVYSRWMSNFHPLSNPESGISGCSARHDRYLPLSSMVGVKVSVDVVKLLSAPLVWQRATGRGKSHISQSNSGHLFIVYTRQLTRTPIAQSPIWLICTNKGTYMCVVCVRTKSLEFIIRTLPFHQLTTGSGREPTTSHTSP